MEVKRVGVIGAGVMGNGIAQVFAQSGYEVMMQDIADEFLQRGMKNIEQNLDRLVSREKMSKEGKEAALGHIKPTLLMSDLKDVDFVVEAVFESMDLKKQVFKEVDELTRPEVILATNTSTFSITEIASATKRSEKVVGMHFFNPVPIMRLVEIVKGYLTSDEAVSVTRALAEKLGKETVLVKKDTPGFIVNRVLIPQFIAAIRLYEEGIASIEDIDKAVKLGLNYPMGPFELMDLTGNDTNVDVLGSFEKELGKEFAYTVPYTLKALVMSGKFGRKTKEGWYKYEK